MRRCVPELDEARTIPRDLYTSAAEAGLFRQLVAAELGGIGGDPVEWLRSSVAAATHHTSFGWIVAQGTATLGWMASGGDIDWVHAVLADPLAAHASSIAGRGRLVPHDEGFVLEGEWSFVSGCTGATWLGGLATIEGSEDSDGLPVMRFALVPAERAEVIDTWDSTGMRATGSHTVRVPEQVIPEAWTFSNREPSRRESDPYRSLVDNGNWPIATSVAATRLGNARRALDEATRVVREKIPATELRPLAEKTSIQRSLMSAEGTYQACYASVEKELISMWEMAVRTGELTSDQRVSLLLANATANQRSVEIVDAACEVTGTSLVNRQSVLGRCLRDAHSLQGHISTNNIAFELAGQVRLGLIPQHTVV